MRSINAVSSWQSLLPRAIGPGRADALAPIEPIRPSRRNPRETTEPLNEHVLSGEYIAGKTASALPLIDFNRHVFDALAKAAHVESEAANTGLAIKAVHAYLLTAVPLTNTSGLGIDGYA